MVYGSCFIDFLFKFPERDIFAEFFAEISFFEKLACVGGFNWGWEGWISGWEGTDWPQVSISLLF